MKLIRFAFDRYGGFTNHGHQAKGRKAGITMNAQLVMLRTLSWSHFKLPKVKWSA